MQPRRARCGRRPRSPRRSSRSCPQRPCSRLSSPQGRSNAARAAFDPRPCLAAAEMIVDQPHRLHERVRRGRADEAPPAPLAGPWRARADSAVAASCASPARSSFPGRRLRLKAPDVVRRAIPPPRRARRARRALLMTASILPRWRTIAASPSRRSTSRSPNRATRSKSKPANAAPERLALAQDRQPREAGLKPLEAQLLEQPHVIGDGKAPLAVVVGAVLGSRAGPPAAGDAVRARNQPVLAHARPRLSTRLLPASSLFWAAAHHFSLWPACASDGRMRFLARWRLSSETIFERVRRVPRGYVTTYGDLSPGAPRHAGRALSRMPGTFPGGAWCEATEPGRREPSSAHACSKRTCPSAVSEW